MHGCNLMRKNNYIVYTSKRNALTKMMAINNKVGTSYIKCLQSRYMYTSVFDVEIRENPAKSCFCFFFQTYEHHNFN